MPTPGVSVGLMQRARVDLIALNVQKLLGKFASAFSGIGLSVLLGFDPPTSMRPFQGVLADNKAIAIAILVIIVVIGAGSFLVTRRRKLDRGRTKNPFLHILRMLSESFVEIIVGFLAGLLLGIGSAPSTIPLLALIRTHPPIGIGIGAALLVVLILAPLIGSKEKEVSEDGAESSTVFSFSHSDARLRFASATSFISLLLLFTLFLTVTVRPSWCPTSICPAPQLVVVTNPNGVNDGTMEAFYLAQQSATFALTQDPSTYTFNNLPNSVGTMELGGAPQLLYRAVIGIHSLQRNTRYGLIIDGVDIVIDKATPISSPVNVFVQGENLSYNTRLYTVTYDDEPTPATIPTKPPLQVISLEVGGSDEISVEVTTHVEVALEFHLSVRYHQIVGGALTRTLVIPHEFSVDFVAPAHWKPYTFSNGKMTPMP